VGGALVFELILPRAWSYAKAFRLDYSPFFVAITTWVASLVLFYIVGEPIRLGRRQWRYLMLFPPTWLAVPLAWTLAAASESLPIGFRPQSTGPDWRHSFPILPIAGALLIAVAARQLRWKHDAARKTLGEIAEAITWQDVEAWISAGERPNASDEPDFFGHRSLAKRIVQVAGAEGRPVALLGRFGTGKSSILNVVRAELRHFSRPVIVADLDVWAVPNPEDVPRLALTRIVTALDDYVDTIEFRALPKSYQRLAAAEPTGRVASILGLNGQADSLDELERLAPILDAIDAQIVLIVEDVERAGQGFDTRHLARLLWALRSVRRSAFILAVDPDHAPVDFSKLCDTIERVPPVEVKHVAKILTLAFSHWRSAYTYIDPHPNRREGDRLRLQDALKEGLMDYMRRAGHDTPLDALVSLLQTPRALKHVVRRADRVWRNLHGEVELDDVVIVSALRHGAPRLFEFLVADIDAARHEPDDLLPRTKKVKAEWDQIVKELPNGHAAQRLIDLIGIEQLTRGHSPTIAAPQAAYVAEPVDYFSRIVAEEIAPGEIRDQAVLRDIDLWKANRGGELIDELLAASDDDDRYQKVWEHFERRHSTQELLALTSQVANRVVARDGARAAGDHPSLLALWRSCNRRERLPQFPQWLRDLILSAVPVSLRFVNELYYYWTGQHGIVNDEDKQRIRLAISEALRAAVKTPADLERIVAPNSPWEISKFITQTGTQPGTASLAEWREFFVPLLLDGASDYPDTMIPALANLAGDEQSGIVVAGVEPPVFINRYKIDRAKLEAFLGDRLDVGLKVMAEYKGNNVYGTRAREDAKLWLEERRSTNTP
jgi:hypothetical protein